MDVVTELSVKPACVYSASHACTLFLSWCFVSGKLKCSLLFSVEATICCRDIRIITRQHVYYDVKEELHLHRQKKTDI